MVLDKILKNIITEIYILLHSVAVYFAIEELYGSGTMANFKCALLNIVIVYCIFRIAFLITKKLFWASLFTNVFFSIFGLAEYYVNQFRGNPFMPWDFQGVAAAADVSGGYSFEIFPAQIVWMIFLLVMIVLSLVLDKKIVLKRKYLSLYSVFILIMCSVILMLAFKSDEYKKLETSIAKANIAFKNQGVVISFVKYCELMKIDTPKGYTKEDAEIISNKYNINSENAISENPDNIIVIMNESFADFSALGNLDEIEESLSFYNSLEKNTLKGNICVPVYGGGTVNTEYEFLTGNSVAFLPAGMPMVSMIKENRPSLAWYLKDEYGYRTNALHLASGKNYNRDKAYKYLGIDKSYFIDDFYSNSIDYFYHMPSDDFDYKQLINMYENKDSDKFFVFNVTIQNHGGYDDATDLKGKETVDLSKYGNFPKSEVYLTCLKASDDALRELIGYFEKVDEKTMIVFFGDHLPCVEDEFLEFLYGKPFDEWSDEEILNKYTTPFMIWTNYDSVPGYIDRISTNYLPLLMLKRAGIDLPVYYKCMDELVKEYPVITINGILSEKGAFCYKNQINASSVFNDYKYMLYNMCVDENVEWNFLK